MDIFCVLCQKHAEISPKNDPVTKALCSTNVTKHKKSDMHSKAVTMERQPAG